MTRTLLRKTPIMAECNDPEVAALQAELAHKQRAAAGVHEAMLGNLKSVSGQAPGMVPLTPEKIAEREAQQAARERLAECERRAAAWESLVNERGSRYADCKLNNFATDHQNQASAVSLLRDYCLNIEQRIAEGEGVILFGPKGTGKDHLAMALAHAIVRAGRGIVWQNGMDMFGDIRDAMDKGDAERAFVGKLVRPDVLYLSDPLPPMGNLTEFQAGMLFRVLDGRYSRRRPVIVTVNVSSGGELDTRLGPQNGDRLRDGALAIFCDWPSYRKVRSA